MHRLIGVVAVIALGLVASGAACRADDDDPSPTPLPGTGTLPYQIIKAVLITDGFGGSYFWNECHESTTTVVNTSMHSTKARGTVAGAYVSWAMVGSLGTSGSLGTTGTPTTETWYCDGTIGPLDGEGCGESAETVRSLSHSQAYPVYWGGETITVTATTSVGGSSVTATEVFYVVRES